MKATYLMIGLLAIVIGAIGGYLYVQKSKAGTFYGNSTKIEGGSIFISSGDKIGGFPLTIDLNINCTSQDLSGVRYYTASKVTKKFVFPKGSNLGAFIPSGSPVILLTKMEEFPQVHTIVVPQALCEGK